jgi:hypothetical protein
VILALQHLYKQPQIRWLVVDDQDVGFERLNLIVHLSFLRVLYLNLSLRIGVASTVIVPQVEPVVILPQLRATAGVRMNGWRLVTA